MNRALVIRTMGDADISGAIVEGMTRRVIPINDTELAMVKAEVAKLRAERDVRAYGATRRFERDRQAMAIKYSTRPVKPVTGAFLAVWGLLWLGIANAYSYFAAWNRRA